MTQKTTSSATYQQSSKQIALFSLFVVFSILMLACTPKDITMLKTDGTEEDADKLLIVDCLLPGQIKKLGAGSTYVTPRRPAKLSALDCENRGGEYVAYDQANSATALKVWLPNAQDGNAVAQTYVGEIYEKGFGIEPDYKMAAAWYKRAADQGHSRAKLNLGYLYEKGLGVEQNLKLALSLYREASGLSDTNIEFESVVDSGTISADVENIRKMKTELSEKQEQLETISQQVSETQTKLAQEKQRLDNEQAQLAKEKQTLQQQKQSATVDKQKLKTKEQQLAKRESELNKRIEEHKLLEQQSTIVQQQTDQRLQSPTQLARVSIAGPSIQLVNPQLVSMRGISVVNVRRGTKTREIIGSIDAPAGLQTLSIDGTQQKVNDKGLFRVLVPLSADRKPVKIVAIDNQGKRAEIEFELVQKDKPTPIKVASPSIKPEQVSGEIGHFHALIIGNDKYVQFPKLSTAVNDAKSVAQVLSSKYGFKTTTLVNANRFMILAALNRLSKNLSEQDNLLVYYAGHGELSVKKDIGFWLPVDADRNNKRKWIPNTAISDVISAMPVKRVLVIADSCYSGSLTRSSIAHVDDNTSTAERLTWLRAMAKSRARLALTSGGLKPVADIGAGNHSLFANALLNVLDANSDILEGQRLYQQVFAKVSLGADELNIDQEPLYAPIRHAGHESGEFFFLPSKES
ncbi:caspase family protein [Kaarinaea lacus]